MIDCYYACEWELLYDIFDMMWEGELDTPYFLIEISYQILKNERDKYEDRPPSVLLQNAINNAETYSEMAKTDESRNLFSASESVLKEILIIYLQEVFLLEDKLNDYAAKKIF